MPTNSPGTPEDEQSLDQTNHSPKSPHPKEDHEEGREDLGLLRERQLTARMTQEVMHIQASKARPFDQGKLMSLLRDMARSNRLHLHPSHSVYADKEEIERATGIRINDRYFFAESRLLQAHWEGLYHPNAARRLLLCKLIEREKAQGDDASLDDRIWYWVSTYFVGSCVEAAEVELPADQDPQAAVAVLEQDFQLVRQLPLLAEERDEVKRHMDLAFLRSQYLIDVSSGHDEQSEAEVQQKLLAIAEAPQAEGMDLRASAICVALQRYRKSVSEGRDFGEEEVKRRAEDEKVDEFHRQEQQRRQRDFEEESAFIESLPLPEWEANDWPKLLLQTARSPYFKINPAVRERVHTHMHWLLDHLPESDQLEDRALAMMSGMLSDYWFGRYYPDDLRWMVLQNEMQHEALGSAGQPGDHMLPTQLALLNRFITGSHTEVAALLLRQDAIEVGRAYQRDMNLIRSAGLSPDVLRESERRYNNSLLDGEIPIVPDRETPEDRREFEEMFAARVAAGDLSQEWASSLILDIFWDYWAPISRRSPRRAE